ncbi:MAG: LacI family DNA-binding transcriptional regulator [Victivallales bacterium]|jgi:LacI family transcriptional regulator
MMKDNVTIYDIAKKTGLSVATVSCVMNGRSNVSLKTSAVVTGAMKELGYTPPPPGKRRGMRSSLKKDKHLNIALLFAGITGAVFNEPVYMDVINGVKSALFKNGSYLSLCSSELNRDSVGNVIPPGSDGVLVFGAPARKMLSELRRFPCVQLMGRIDEDESWDHVTYNNSSVGRLAADYLISRGFMNCAFIGDKRESGSLSGERGAAFADAMAKAGGKTRFFSADNIIIKTAEKHEIEHEVVRKVFEEITRDKSIKAVFTFSDMLANAIYPLMLVKGLTIGKEMELVSCNNETAYLINMNPKPVEIDIHAGKIGYKAVDQLLWRIKNPSEPVVKSIMEPALIVPERTGGR